MMSDVARMESLGSRIIAVLNPFTMCAIIWALVISTYLMDVSYSIDPQSVGLLIGVAVLSIACFGAAYYITCKYIATTAKMNPLVDRVSPQKLRYFYVAALGLCLVIVIWNLFQSGLFPYMAAYGYKVKNYKQYGRFKGVLFPMLFIMCMLASLEKKVLLRLSVQFFCLAVAWLYLSRAALFFIIVQFIGFIIASKNFKTVLHLVVTICVSSAFMFFSIGYLGKIRTGDAVFKRAMQIRSEYASKSTSMLWCLSYISMPSANLLSYIEKNENFCWGRQLLNSSVPAPLKVDGWKKYAAQFRPNKRNTACTYLGLAYLDFGWTGIILVNILYGVIGAWLKVRCDQNYGIGYAACYSVYMTALILLFFSNMIFYFPIIFQVFALAMISKYISVTAPANASLAQDKAVLVNV